MSTNEEPASIVDDRTRFGRLLLIAGTIGAIAALVVGIAGWIVSNKASEALTGTIRPMVGIVGDVAETIGASQILVTRTTEAIGSIESATRSSARALDSVTLVLEEASTLIGGDLADGLESAVATLPALTDTSRVVDRTMRALSFVGVDYDPEVPLDESLTALEQSLAPIPDQLRGQVELFETVQTDIDQIAEEAGSLSAVLLETRIDMMEAERILASASEHAAEAVAAVENIEADLNAYDTLSKVVVVAVTVALLAAASAPLLIGLHYLREGE